MKMFIKKLYLPISMLIMLLICGCAKYNPQPLRPIGLDQKIEEQNNVQVAKKVLTEEECRTAFDRRIIKRGYQPVQISIRNNSNKNYILDSSDMNLTLAPIQSVTKKLHRDPVTKGIKYFIIAGPVWGIFEGLNSQNVNNQITADLNERCLDETRIVNIKPHQSLNTVVFVSADQANTNSLDLKLRNSENNEYLTFNLS